MEDITVELILLCIAAFTAGFVDAIVGGGGLIQLPAALVLLPQYPVANVIGTLKIPAFSGTALASWQYALKVKLNRKLLPAMMLLACISSFAGSSANAGKQQLYEAIAAGSACIGGRLYLQQ
jgi:uncharacterized membrane protein YfcA